MTPAPTPTSSAWEIRNAMNPTTPPVTSEPNSPPNSARSTRLITNTPTSSTGNRLLNPWPREGFHAGAGAGSGSPLITAMMRPTPAVTPPSKSPWRKRGVMSSSMIRFATVSVSAPSSPLPTSIRTV